MVRMSMKFAGLHLQANHVEGRQPKSCSVRHQPDIAVHLDVVELTVLGDALAFIVFLLFAQRGSSGWRKTRCRR